jgi:hypothetical protein
MTGVGCTCPQVPVDTCGHGGFGWSSTCPLHGGDGSNRHLWRDERRTVERESECEAEGVSREHFWIAYRDVCTKCGCVARVSP